MMKIWRASRTCRLVVLALAIADHRAGVVWHWFLYQFTDKVAGIWRAEVFWDPYGLATGSPNDLREMTLGLNIQTKPRLWLRPEARYDWAQFTHPFNDGTRNSQFTMGFDVIVLF